MRAPLRILKIGEPKLRRVSETVTRVGDGDVKLVEAMIPTMRANSGVGLAAVQVGVSRRIVVVELPAGHESDDPDVWDWDVTELHVLVNPEIVAVEDYRDIDEGCLSLPGYQATLSRGRAVKARCRSLNGEQISIEASGLFAQALQHEIDHLEGRLLHDSLDSLLELRQVKPPWIRSGGKKRQPQAG